MRNYRQEIEDALAGEAPRHVPFTIYSPYLVPKGFDLRPLQEKGLGICHRTGVFRVVQPNVQVRKTTDPNGDERTHYVTPLGALSEAWRRAAYGAPAPIEHRIKRRDDYRVAEFIVRDTHYVPAYEGFLAKQRALGETGVAVGGGGYSPLVDLQVLWIGQENFCYELADNPDALLGLYETMVRSHEKMYEVVARGPSEYVLYCGNLVPEMIGRQRIIDYVLPCWRKFADRLHEQGKKLGSHLDANNRAILDLVASAPLDFIEAFTPPPDCNVSVAEARAAWPGKRLWINFPSSVHLRPDEEIRKATREILEQAGDRRGFLMGITEDVPVEHMGRSLSAILDAINEFVEGSGS